jgi:hypothetical protein
MSYASPADGLHIYPSGSHTERPKSKRQMTELQMTELRMTEHRKTQHQMTERRMTERRMTESRMTKCQKRPIRVKVLRFYIYMCIVQYSTATRHKKLYHHLNKTEVFLTYNEV